MMNKIERWDKVQECLESRKTVSIEALKELLGVSIATIRRDMIEMEKEGLLERYHGGVRSAKGMSVEQVPGIEMRLTENSEQKREIAKKAASLIKDGESVFLDASSTTLFMPEYITAKDIFVVTNSYMIIPQLFARGIQTYVINGMVWHGGTIICPEAIELIKAFTFNKAFLGVYGINVKHGFTTYDMLEGDVKKSVIAQAEKSYILADDSKFQKWSYYIYAKIEDATIICNKRIESNSEIKDIIFTEDK